MTDYRATPTAGAYQTTVQLLRVPLRIDDENQMYFANQTAQNNYFQSVIWKSLPSQTYQRENAYFRVDDDYDAIVTNCNYLRYKNAITGNKWFYAYITEFEYKNPNTTFVHFKIDAYQTYLFDITWKDCFIEREHVKDDSMGAHYIPEPVEYADMTVRELTVKWPNESMFVEGRIDLLPVILLTEDPEDPEASPCELINGVPQLTLYWVPFGSEALAPLNPWNVRSNLQNFYEYLRSKNKIDTIVGAFMVPHFALVGSPYRRVPDYNGLNTGQLIDFGTTGSGDQDFLLHAISHPATCSFVKPMFSNYEPKNNKLYTSQYMQCIITNMQGQTITLKPEYMFYADDTAMFQISMALKCPINTNPVIYLSVNDYQITLYPGANNYEYYTLPCSGLPVPSVVGDFYTSWLSGNANGTALAAWGDVLSGTVGAVTNPLVTVNALNSLTTQIGKLQDLMTVADPIKISSNSCDKYGADRLGYKIYLKQIPKDKAIAIDTYFNMFGYQVNELKIPEFATRQYYNYYKMSVCNITGNIPQTALDEIRAKFQRGITLWNTPDVGNYRNGNNPIVTS